MVKINLWSGWQEASATGWVWRCRKAELCCSWKLKTPSQHLPPWRDHTDQDGQHETGMQTCSAGRDPAPWVPISMWWRKGTCAQVHRLQTGLVWLLKSFFFFWNKTIWGALHLTLSASSGCTCFAVCSSPFQPGHWGRFWGKLRSCRRLAKPAGSPEGKAQSGPSSAGWDWSGTASAGSWIFSNNLCLAPEEPLHASCLLGRPVLSGQWEVWGLSYF